MSSTLKILKEYWSFDSFRAPQQEIIDTVIQGKDVVALLPTGAGKSICFQVPALLTSGVCLVISPLIALMQDQVSSLQDKGIKATRIASGTSENDIIQLFDTIKYGNYKFLYLSPERLQSTLIQQKIKELDVSLIAIDEAHCISEWGHDFRPSYRNIKVLRELLSDINFITLTATANDKVLKDISTNLALNKPVVFRKTYFRANLAYQIFEIENKLLRLEQIFTKTKSPGIVYVNSRNKTKHISDFLNARNYSSVYYHGGMLPEQKREAFESWMSEKSNIMVSTNAFGMGIDKPNVGVVVHFDLPFSIENYVQESGRAGRNGKKAFAVLLKNDNDISIAREQLNKHRVTLLEIKKIHQKLYQYFRISYGELRDENFQFQTADFCNAYQFAEKKVMKVLQVLANNGIIEVNNTYNKKSSLIFNASSQTVISYVQKNQTAKKLVDTLLRNYSGLFRQTVFIDEFLLSKKINNTSKQVVSILETLHQDGILTYQKIDSEVEIRFLFPREDDLTINRFSKEISKIFRQKEQKANDFLMFIQNDKKCRSIQVLAYFDEYSENKCGICDICLSEKKESKIDTRQELITLLTEHDCLSSQEISQCITSNEKDILIHLQLLLEEEKITLNYQNKYQLKF